MPFASSGADVVATTFRAPRFWNRLLQFAVVMVTTSAACVVTLTVTVAVELKPVFGLVAVTANSMSPAVKGAVKVMALGWPRRGTGAVCGCGPAVCAQLMVTGAPVASVAEASRNTEAPEFTVTFALG